MTVERVEEPIRSGLEFVGPFESHDVVLNGRQVPFLSATPIQGGRVLLHLDRRFMLDLSLQEAEHLMPFIAHCIAVGMGYVGFPDADADGPVAAQIMPRVGEWPQLAQ
jgi:hypothetical protein